MSRTPAVVLQRNMFVENFHERMADFYAISDVGDGICRQGGRIALEQANTHFFERNEDYVAGRTVEYLHTYSPDRLVNPSVNDEYGLTSPLAPYTQFTDTNYSSKLRALAASLGDDTEEVLTVGFIDDVTLAYDVNELRDDGDMDAARRLRCFNGVSLESVEAATQADYVSLESSYVAAGLRIIDTLKQNVLPAGYRLSQSGSKLLYAQDSSEVQIGLIGFKGVEDPLHPSCAVLDLAWLLHRLRLAPVATTILPVGYEKQQRNVRLIAQALPDLPEGKVESIFIDSDFKVNEVVSWHANSHV